jgi:hypothetical protein
LSVGATETWNLWENLFSRICRNTRKIGKNGNKKVKLNGLIHSKTVLVKDHTKKKQENPIIQIL